MISISFGNSPSFPCVDMEKGYLYLKKRATCMSFILSKPLSQSFILHTIYRKDSNIARKFLSRLLVLSSYYN